MAQMVKTLSTMWDNQVRSLGQEDPTEKRNLLQDSSLENSMDRGV